MAVLLTVSSVQAVNYQIISNGRLGNDLDGNGQSINGLNDLVFGAGTGTGRIHILPSGTPTTAADGIKIGSDIVLYRSGTGTMTLTGDLVVSGTITGTGNLLSLSGNNTWTGTNIFNGAVTLGSTFTVGTSGIAFSGSGASNTRTNLSLRPGIDIQAYSANLLALAGLAVTDGNVIVGNGTTWVAESGATARTSLGLGSASNVTFADITGEAGSLASLVVTTGGVELDGATSLADSLEIGGSVNMWASASNVLTINDSVVVANNLTVGSGSDTFTLLGTLVIGADTNLYRSAADTLKTDDAFVAESLTLTTPLGVASGGLGMSLAGVPADRYLYTSSTGVLASGTITAAARGLLDDALTSDMRTTLGLGTSAVLNVASSGDAASGEVVKGNDTRLTNSRAPSGSAGGDLTGTYPNPTLTTSGVTADTYGSSTEVAVITVDAKGRVTGVTESAITGAAPTGTAGGSLSGTYPNPTIADNAVVLGTKTTGDYVQSISSGTGISVSSAPGEGTTHSISVANDGVTLGTKTAGNYVADLTAGTGISLTGSTGEGASQTVAVADDGVTLGTKTTGDYVGSLVAGTGISITNPSGEGLAATISTVQNIATTASPTFDDLSLTGDLAVTGTVSFGAATYSSLNVSGGILTGITHGLRVHVNAASSGDTDTRAGLSNYDENRPFTTMAAAVSALAAGDTLVLHAASSDYTALTLPLDTNLEIELGAELVSLIVNHAGTSYVSGAGTINNTSGAAITVDGGAVLHLAVKEVRASAKALQLNNGVVFCRSPLVTTGTSSAVNLLTTSDLTLYPGSAILGSAISADAIDGSGTAELILRAPVQISGTVSGIVVTDNEGFYNTSERLVAKSATFSGATSSGDGVLIGDVSLYQSAADEITLVGDLVADSLELATPLAVAEGGGGATTPLGIRTNLEIPTLPTSSYADTFMVGNPAGTSFIASSFEESRDLMLGNLQNFTANGSVLDTSDVVSASNTSTTITLTLPDANTVGLGKFLMIYQAGSLTSDNYTSIAASGGDNIQGSSTLKLTKQLQTVILRPANDGNTWLVVAYPDRPKVYTTAITATIPLDTALVTTTNTTTTSIVLTLPDVGDTLAERSLVIKQTGAITTGTTTVTAAAGDNIDGSATFVISQPNEALILRRGNNTTDWHIAARYATDPTSVTTSSSGSLGSTSQVVELTNTGDATFTLPAASAVTQGRLITLKQTGNIDTDTTTISPAGADTIDGSNNPVYINRQYDTLLLQRTSTTAWRIISRYAGVNVQSGSSTASIAADVNVYEATSTSSSNITLTLPGLAALRTGTMIQIQQTGLLTTGVTTIAAGGGDNIEGQASTDLTKQWDKITLQKGSSSTGWRIVSRYSEGKSTRTVSGSTTLTAKDDVLYVTGTATITLPGVSSSGIGEGKEFTIVNAPSGTTLNSITINTSSANTIAGNYTSGEIVLRRQGESLSLIARSTTDWTIQSWEKSPKRLSSISAATDLSTTSNGDKDAEIIIGTNGSTVTITLPTTTVMAGHKYTVRAAGAGDLTLDPASAVTIDGSTTKTVSTGTSATVVYDGSVWRTID